jgi:N-acylglucosamine 2-epimerase
MALAEYSRASGETKLLEEAKREFEKVWEFSKDLSKVGRAPMAGAPPLRNLAVPMILLNLIEELDDGGVSTYAAEIDECIAGVQLHVNESRRIVFENVLPDGGFLDTPEGRLLNPGHAIEAGWFLQHWAQRLKRGDLSTKAANIVRWSHERGWDNEFGGLYYFLDSENKPPLALEWDMKLWWPHCEALYAHLLNYRLFRDQRDSDLFLQTDRYTFDHFPDPQHGEWYGYLNRRGEVTHRLKGGPYKCAFHVPRALWLCWETLKQLEAE